MYVATWIWVLHVIKLLDTTCKMYHVYIMLFHKLSNMNTCTHTHVQGSRWNLWCWDFSSYFCMVVVGRLLKIKHVNSCVSLDIIGITLPWRTTNSTECIVYFCWCGCEDWRSLYIPTVYTTLNSILVYYCSQSVWVRYWMSLYNHVLFNHNCCYGCCKER